MNYKLIPSQPLQSLQSSSFTKFFNSNQSKNYTSKTNQIHTQKNIQKSSKHKNKHKNFNQSSLRLSQILNQQLPQRDIEIRKAIQIRFQRTVMNQEYKYNNRQNAQDCESIQSGDMKQFTYLRKIRFYDLFEQNKIGFLKRNEQKSNRRQQIIKSVSSNKSNNINNIPTQKPTLKKMVRQMNNENELQDEQQRIKKKKINKWLRYINDKKTIQRIDDNGLKGFNSKKQNKSKQKNKKLNNSLHNYESYSKVNTLSSPLLLNNSEKYYSTLHTINSRRELNNNIYSQKVLNLIRNSSNYNKKKEIKKVYKKNRSNNCRSQKSLINDIKKKKNKK